jgi:hypothetical protein
METITLPENKEDILAEIISEMASNKDGREALISILRKNGVSIVETDNNEIIYTAIYTALANSRTFRNDLKKSVFNYLKGDDEFSNFISPNLSTSLVDQTTGKLKLSSDAQARLDAQNRRLGKGGFLSGIFSKENAAALSNFAIGVVTNKLTEKANKQQIDQGIQYQVARTEASDKKKQEEDNKKK